MDLLLLLLNRVDARLENVAIAKFRGCVSLEIRQRTVGDRVVVMCLWR